MDSEREHAEEFRAAEEAVDPDRLLDGEDPSTHHLEDATHWVTVYSELLTFKERLVDTAQDGLTRMTEFGARKEAANQDLVILTAERERLVRRLSYWKARQQELVRQTGR